MAEKEFLAQRARRLNGLVTAIIDDGRDQDAANTIQRILMQAETAVDALQRIASGVADLETYGLTPPVIPRAVRADVTQARTALRRTATSITGATTHEMASGLNTSSVSKALGQSVEGIVRSLTTQARRAAEAERQSLLPPDLSEPIAAVSGVNTSQILALKRIQRRLQEKIPDSDSLEDIAARLREIVQLVDEWKITRPLVHAASERQHPEVREFVTAASAPEGASWAMVTTEVTAWLNDDLNGDSIRIHLS